MLSCILIYLIMEKLSITDLHFLREECLKKQNNIFISVHSPSEYTYFSDRIKLIELELDRRIELIGRQYLVAPDNDWQSVTIETKTQ